MVRKPTSGDSEQREREAARARKSSTLSAANVPPEGASASRPPVSVRPMHGSSDGESAHGALPRPGIEDEQGD
ncbi:MAG: hypothetical protein ACT443_11710 [Gemmatimonadota bacterium]